MGSRNIQGFALIRAVLFNFLIAVSFCNKRFSGGDVYMACGVIFFYKKKFQIFEKKIHFVLLLLIF